MATSYFRERARNPYIRPQVAPVFEEEPTTAPTFSRPMPMASEVIERPPLRAVAPPPTAFSTADPITAASEAYQADAPTTFGGKFKDVLKSTALGFLQGAARNPADPLSAGIGGAVTGGAIQAISPQTGRAFQFETMERPHIEEQLRREEERRKKQQAAEDRDRVISMDELKREDIRAGIDLQKAQAQKSLTPTAPRAVTPQMKLGRNRQTGQMDYYNALDPEQRDAFEPVAESPFRSSPLGIFRTDTGEITASAPEKKPSRPPAGVSKDISEVDQLKQNAQALWSQWGTLPEGSQEREEAKVMASEAQAAYNQAVTRFGELYGDWYEVGGFTEPSGNQGWAYAKRRSAKTASATARATAQGGRKAAVGQDFINHVANSLKISPEDARRRIEADGYEVR